MNNLVVSIVSHGQGDLVLKLLRDFDDLDFNNKPQTIILTFNIKEDISFLDDFKNLSIFIIHNNHPKGFGENHNHAFSKFKSRYFCIINPDVRLVNINFHNLTNQINDSCKIIAPKVVAPSGAVEDSFRKYPTITNIIKRKLSNRNELDYCIGSDTINVEWVAGMFVIFDSDHFKNINGFDQKFFMYLEDVDICKRTHANGFKVSIDPKEVVLHDARRASLKSFVHFKWHLASLIRFLIIKPLHNIKN